MPVAWPSNITQIFRKLDTRPADAGFSGLFTDSQHERGLDLPQVIDDAQDQRLRQHHIGWNAIIGNLEHVAI